MSFLCQDCIPPTKFKTKHSPVWVRLEMVCLKLCRWAWFHTCLAFHSLAVRYRVNGPFTLFHSLVAPWLRHAESKMKTLSLGASVHYLYRLFGPSSADTRYLHASPNTQPKQRNKAFASQTVALLLHYRRPSILLHYRVHASLVASMFGSMVFCMPACMHGFLQGGRSAPLGVYWVQAKNE